MTDIFNNHRITWNTYKWPTVNRAVFLAENGAGCRIAEKREDHKPYIWNLNVSHKARRGGFATALMDAAEQWCWKQGYDSVTLEWDKRESAYWTLDWYVRRGYQERELGQYSSLMEKKL